MTWEAYVELRANDPLKAARALKRSKLPRAALEIAASLGDAPSALVLGSKRDRCSLKQVVRACWHAEDPGATTPWGHQAGVRAASALLRAVLPVWDRAGLDEEWPEGTEALEGSPTAVRQALEAVEGWLKRPTSRGSALRRAREAGSRAEAAAHWHLYVGPAAQTQGEARRKLLREVHVGLFAQVVAEAAGASPKTEDELEWVEDAWREVVDLLTKKERGVVLKAARAELVPWALGLERGRDEVAAPGEGEVIAPRRALGAPKQPTAYPLGTTRESVRRRLEGACDREDWVGLLLLSRRALTYDPGDRRFRLYRDLAKQQLRLRKRRKSVKAG